MLHEFSGARNYSRRWTELYAHCLVLGYAYGRFQQHTGEPHVDPLKDFVGRMRILISRWRALRRPMGIPFWRLPLSLFFLGFYSTAVTHGLELAHRSRPEPFASF